MHGATSDLTGAKCTPNTIHWTYDTWALANGTGQAIVKTGGDTWFFLTADYAFGHALERDTAAVVVKNGGKVLGRVVVHYLIHSDDSAQFAAAGLDAATCYSKIAPDVPHALHMPSHIFTRLPFSTASVNHDRSGPATGPSTPAMP
jgi:hypothetical protein